MNTYFLRCFTSAILSVLLLFPNVVRGQVPGSEPVRAPHGMVASSNALASQVGVAVLKHGGNAVDAAVAVGLALAVTHPRAGNLGGGGFMLIRMADGRTAALDYRETAPAAASRDMYLDKTGQIIPHASVVGHRAVGVPGTVAGLALALQRFGTRPWRTLVEPARQLAAQGFPVSTMLATSLRGASNLAQFPESRRVFQRGNRFYREGETFRQPDLAATLQRLETSGPREFYTGRTAALIAQEMQRGGGLITRDDLAHYQPKWRTPLRGTYRGYEILTMPPPSSGGFVLLEMLNMLETRDLASQAPNGSARAHVLLEAMRRAFADRAQYGGDPDFVSVPTQALIAKAYGQARAAEITLRATPSAQVHAGQFPPTEGTNTTHFCVVDAQGNMVSNTYTLNDNYGSGVTVPGTGVLLNDEMDDFTSKAGAPNLFGLIQGEANAIAPHKRPLSSMTPTIVLHDGKPAFALGSPGGPTIINTVLQILVHLIDDRMTMRQAVDAPRLHHQWLPDTVRFEPFGVSPDTRDALTQLGYVFDSAPHVIGDAQIVGIEPGTGIRLGASDPRNPDGTSVGD